MKRKNTSSKFSQQEIDNLIKATQKNREELKKSWQKFEDLDAAIQSAKSDQEQRKQARKRN